MLHVDAHEITAKRPALALASPSSLENIVIELERVIVAEHRLDRGRRPTLTRALAAASTAASPTSAAAAATAATAGR
jgi:hypothetical protein